MLKKVLQSSSGYLIFLKEEFTISDHEPSSEENRETLLRLCDYFEKKGCCPRILFNQLTPCATFCSLPGIVANDRFLAHYASGAALPMSMIHELHALPKSFSRLSPITTHYRVAERHFFDVGSALPGLRAKLSSKMRLQADALLLEKVRHDLRLAAEIEDHEKRKALTFSILSFSAAYRELDGESIAIPDFEEAGKMVTYQCKQHLIADGLKTMSLSAGYGIPPLYLCRGTELWPSQPFMLHSILANFAEHGSATESYAHSWRRIHKQLRDLQEEAAKLPIVMGHSMGGALACQIALYSHDLIESSHAYNPPVPNERDALFFKSLSSSVRKKVNIYVNLDDPVFWRIGAKVIGNVTLLIGKKRWRYHPIVLKDLLLFFPAVIKFFLNITHAFPAHQKITTLCESSLSVSLTEEEIALENEERATRFDALHFLPKLYDPLKTIIFFLKKLLNRRWEEQLLSNEIEILALHEQDLLDARTESNYEEVKEKVQAIKIQKELLQKKLFSLKNYK